MRSRTEIAETAHSRAHPADALREEFLTSESDFGLAGELMGAATILLIEDDLNVYHGIQRRLKASNYDTLYAPDAVASISQARQHRPDLILLDIGLPAGDGFEVMNRLRQFPDLSTIPVIVMSGRDRAANESRALRAGATAFLQKPVGGDTLLKTIERCLSKRQPIADGKTYSLEAAAPAVPAVNTYTLSR